MSKDKNNQKNDNNDCYTLLGVVKIMKIVVKTEGEQKWLKRKIPRFPQIYQCHQEHHIQCTT